METERCVNKCPVLSLSECVNKPCVVRGGHTDLFCEEGHDGEDDERHKDAVRPELQLVSIHSPGKKHTSVTYPSLSHPTPAGTDAEIKCSGRSSCSSELRQH